MLQLHLQQKLCYSYTYRINCFVFVCKFRLLRIITVNLERDFLIITIKRLKLIVYDNFRVSFFVVIISTITSE
jgi:hypothetical protein